mgnify:CR=1 FL=1
MRMIDKAEILDAFDTTAEKRKKHWIAGVPDQSAIWAIIRDIAHNLKIDKSEVAANIEERRQMALCDAL